MRRVILVGSLVILNLISFNAIADEMKEKIYLVQLYNQLSAMQPIILAAKAEQTENTRIKFHYTQYRDSQGQLHNGLLEDIAAIKQGIAEKLDQVSVEPRAIKPIKGDYLDDAK